MGTLSTKSPSEQRSRFTPGHRHLNHEQAPLPSLCRPPPLPPPRSVPIWACALKHTHTHTHTQTHTAQPHAGGKAEHPHGLNLGQAVTGSGFRVGTVGSPPGEAADAQSSSLGFGQRAENRQGEDSWALGLRAGDGDGGGGIRTHPRSPWVHEPGHLRSGVLEAPSSGAAPGNGPRDPPAQPLLMEWRPRPEGAGRAPCVSRRAPGRPLGRAQVPPVSQHRHHQEGDRTSLLVQGSPRGPPRLRPPVGL